MFRSRRKKTYCQNCQYPLTDNYNFCPECGQENTDKLVSFKTLIGDFFVNYFSYDSRLFNTVKPFFFKPGFLSREFIAGRRTKYMHPLRMYLIISFFYFLSLSLIISRELEDGKMLDFKRTTNSQVMDSTNLMEVNNIPPPQAPPSHVDSVSKEKNDAINEAEQQKEDNYAKLDEEDYVNNLKILVKEDVTPEEVLKAFKFENTAFKNTLARQAIKLSNERKEVVFSYLIKNASIMMFILLPFFALLLKLFYVRRKKFYVEHVTFTLHIHSFMFFVFLLVIIINYLWPNDDVLSIALIIIFLYIFFSIKNVYQQSWIKSLFKLIFLTFGYIVSFFLFLSLTITISFFIY